MRKNLGLSGVTLLIALAVGGAFIAQDGFSQDYIDNPATTQDNGTSSSSVTPTKKAIQLETEYEKRLRENIQNQLKKQQQAASGSTDSTDNTGSASDTATDTSGTNEVNDTAAASNSTADCSTLSKAVLSITEAAAQGSGGDSSVKQAVGKELTSLIRSVSEGYDNLPEQIVCSFDGATAVENIDAAAKKDFENAFLAACPIIAQEVQQSIQLGGLAAYQSYIRSRLSQMSEVSLNDTVVDQCNHGETVLADNAPAYSDLNAVYGSGSSGSGAQNSGSSSSGTGTTTTTVEKTTAYPQSYPSNYVPPDDGGHNHTATATQSGPTSIPDPPASHNDDPPGVSFPPGARRLKMKMSSKVYANCIFHDGTSPVPDCKRKLDYVHSDMLASPWVTRSMDMGMYHNIYDICKATKDPACEDGDGGYATMLKGYMTPESQTKNNPRISWTSSCHPDAKASDVEFSKAKPDEALKACCQLGSKRARCGSYGGFTEISSCTNRAPPIWKGDKAPSCSMVN